MLLAEGILLVPVLVQLEELQDGWCPMSSQVARNQVELQLGVEVDQVGQEYFLKIGTIQFQWDQQPEIQDSEIHWAEQMGHQE